MRTMVGLGAGLVVAGLLSTSLAAGCGNGDDDDTSDGGSGKDGGTTGTKDGSTAVTDGSTGGDSGGGSVTTTAGTLLFGAGGTDNNDTPSGYQIIGAFVTGSTSGTGGGSPCGAVVDNCQYCGGAALDGGSVHVDITQESAGTLTVDDGTAAIATLTYDTTIGIYQSDSEDGQSTSVWAAGDTLNVSASGAAFPAFTGSIKAPASLTGVTPAFADETPLPVSTSGLTVSWTPSGDASQVKLLLGVDASFNSTSVSCTVADSAGKIVVPAALLAQLASDGDPGGTVGLTRTLTSSATATGGATVALTAQALQYTGEFTFSP